MKQDYDIIEKRCNLISEPINLTLTTGEECIINLSSTTFQTYYVIGADVVCNVLDVNLTISKNIFSEITKCITDRLLDLDYHKSPLIEDIYISIFNIKIILDDLVLYLYSVISPDILDKIRKPKKFTNLISGIDEDYNYIKQSDIPSVDPNYCIDVLRRSRRGHKIYNTFKKGSNYTLSDEYKVTVLQDGRNYDFNSKVIYPIFITYIYAGVPKIHSHDDLDIVIQEITEKFNTFDVEIRFDKFLK